MAGFANVLGRADLTDVQVPDQVINEVLQEAPSQSAVLSRARTVRMSSKKTKQPVLASLPDAYWVDGDTGLKQTTKNDWDNVTMTAEELAVIVPIPDAVVADSGLPLWEMIKPLLVEAIGKKVDTASLFGVDKPASWPTALVRLLSLQETLSLRAREAISVSMSRTSQARSLRMVSRSTVSRRSRACSGRWSASATVRAPRSTPRRRVSLPACRRACTATR